MTEHLSVILTFSPKFTFQLQRIRIDIFRHFYNDANSINKSRIQNVQNADMYSLLRRNTLGSYQPYA